MKTEMTITTSTAATVFQEISKLIEEEKNFPSHDDQWMEEMLQFQSAIGESDRITIED